MSSPKPRSRLLLVDDEEGLAVGFVRFFRRCGFDVDVACEPEEAAVLIDRTEYAVVITDLRLGRTYGVEGLEVVALARQRSKRTRIMMLTAYGSPEIQEGAMRAGADAFRHKPVMLADILRWIESIPRVGESGK